MTPGTVPRRSATRRRAGWWRRSRLIPVVAAAGLVAALTVAPVSAVGDGTALAQEPSPIDGSIANCSDFILEFLGVVDIDTPDPGWVHVQRGNPGFEKFRSVSGVVTKSKITHTDYPDVHDSHDQNTDILVDPGQEDILSDAAKNDPNDPRPRDTLELEWETGILPDEFSGDGSRHTFPKWAWPNLGDRVWANGHWIFDCGHPEGDDYRTEIHPARAIASMRQQFQTLPSSGATPVPVTATDLYIHGQAGMVTDVLECGQEILLGPTPGCATFPAPEPHQGTPIDDDFSFEICLPPLPFDKAAPDFAVEKGPGNTVTGPALEPDLDPDGDGVVFEDSAGACAADPAKFGPKMVQVKVPLEGSGVQPTDVYARRIRAGWVFPPEDLRHFRVTLVRGDMMDDLEGFDPADLSDCECSFFWLNVDRAPDEWARLADFDVETCQAEVAGVCISHNTIEDWDDDQVEGPGSIGNGELEFSGPTYDFYVGNGQSYTIRANGYDGGVGEDLPPPADSFTDCFDSHFGEHDFGSHVDVTVFPPSFTDPCYISMAISDAIDVSVADNDPFEDLTLQVNSPYPVGGGVLNPHNPANEYDLAFDVEEVPLTAEEEGADLVLTKDCKPDQGALAGVEFTCTILVENPQGPGLPSNVVVHDTLLTNVDPGDYVMDEPTFTFAGLGGLTDPCITEDNPVEEIPGGKEFTCEIGTVPIGGKAIITIHITSQEGGDFNNYADVFSDSADPDLSNNRDNDSVHVTAVADLSITKSDDEDPLTSGTELTYTMEVGNDGPSTAVNVLAEDFLPNGVAIIAVSGTGGASCLFGVPGDVTRPTTCNFDTIPPGGTETMTIVVNVLPGVHNSLQNDVRVSSDTLDRNNSNNVDDEDTSVQVADIQIVKTSAADTGGPSQEVAYTLTVHNNGPADAQNVQVTDDLPLQKMDRVFWIPGAPTCTKPPGGTLLTCTLGTVPAEGTTTISIFVVYKGNRGIVSNTADVTTTTFDPNLTNNSSTKLVLVGQPPKP